MTGIHPLDLLIKFSAHPTVLTGNALDILSDLLDHLAQFQLREPARRDGGGAVLHAEQVAGDEAGAAAVTTMVYRGDDAAFQ